MKCNDKAAIQEHDESNTSTTLGLTNDQTNENQALKRKTLFPVFEKKMETVQLQGGFTGSDVDIKFHPR